MVPCPVTADMTLPQVLVKMYEVCKKKPQQLHCIFFVIIATTLFNLYSSSTRLEFFCAFYLEKAQQTSLFHLLDIKHCTLECQCYVIMS